MTTDIVKRLVFGYDDNLTGTTERTPTGKYIGYKARENYPSGITPTSLHTPDFTQYLIDTLAELSQECGITLPDPEDGAPIFIDGLMPDAFIANTNYDWSFRLADVLTLPAGVTLGNVSLTVSIKPTFLSYVQYYSYEGVYMFRVSSTLVPAGTNQIPFRLTATLTNGKSASIDLIARPKNTEAVTIYGYVVKTVSSGTTTLFIGPFAAENPYQTLKGPAGFVDTQRQQMDTFVATPSDNIIGGKTVYFKKSWQNLPQGQFIDKIEHLGQTIWVLFTNGPGDIYQAFVPQYIDPGSPVGTVSAPTWAAYPTVTLNIGESSRLQVPANFTLGVGGFTITVQGTPPDGFTLIPDTGGVLYAGYVVPPGTPAGLVSVTLRLKQGDGQYVDNILKYQVLNSPFYTYIDVESSTIDRVFTGPQRADGGYSMVFESPGGTAEYPVTDPFGATINGKSYAYRLRNFKFPSGLIIVTQKVSNGAGTVLKTQYSSFTGPLTGGIELVFQDIKPTRPTTGAPTYQIDPAFSQMDQGSSAYARLFQHVPGVPTDTLFSGAEWIYDAAYSTLPSWISINQSTGLITTGLNPDTSGVGITFKLIAKSNNGAVLDSKVITINARNTVVTSDESDETTTSFYTTAGVNNPPIVAHAMGNISVPQGVPFSFPMPKQVSSSLPQFTDPDGDTLSYQLQYSTDGITWTTTYPGWLTATGTSFSGTAPVTGGAQSHKLRIVASDGKGGAVADPFTLFAQPAN